MDFKYKGISKKDIEKIQKINMPRFSEPVIDYNIMRVNHSLICDCIDKIAEREARDREIYIICEMAKLYLDSIKQEKCCATCAYHDDWTWVCFNPDSDDRADFTDETYVCDCWRKSDDCI